MRRTLADGTVREYSYNVGQARPKAARGYDPNCMGALVVAFEGSPEWRALAEQTRRTYGTYLRAFHGMRYLPVRDINRRGLLDVRDAIAGTRGPGAATGFCRTASALFRWALDRDWIEASPMTGVKPLPGGTLLAWTEAEARLAMRELPEPLRRAVVLAYHTGQRRGDLVRLPWSAYDGRSIRLRQQKTGMDMVIPVHPELRTELEEWTRTRQAVTILTAHRGGAWAPQLLSHALPPALAAIGIGRKLNIHGLRKLAATRLAEAGCSALEIAAITGHKSLSMVQLYTASADQERLATAALIRLQNGNAKRRKSQ